MIIKNYSDCFSVEFTREDWLFNYTYTLLELLKSIPKGYRRFDWNTKLWIVSDKYLSILNREQFYTDEEELEGKKALNSFLSLFE